MKKKGISPLIAAVLLIAFTMAVASLFAQWAPQLIQNAQGDTSNRTETIQQCSDITLAFVSADAENATVQQASGSEGVGNVSVTWFYEGNNPVQNWTTLDGPGSAERLTTGSSSTSGYSVDEIQAQALNCEGSGTATYTP